METFTTQESPFRCLSNECQLSTLWLFHWCFKQYYKNLDRWIYRELTQINTYLDDLYQKHLKVVFLSLKENEKIKIIQPYWVMWVVFYLDIKFGRLSETIKLV
jgi:hypothetical protein